MGKKKDKAGDKAAKAAKIPKHIAGFKLPKDVRRKGEALIAKASSAEGQAALAKGLTVAAGFATMAAERSRRAATPAPTESGEGATGAARSPPPPVDPSKVVEAVQTVANEVLGRLFGGKRG